MSDAPRERDIERIPKFFAKSFFAGLSENKKSGLQQPTIVLTAESAEGEIGVAYLMDRGAMIALIEALTKLRVDADRANEGREW